MHYSHFVNVELIFKIFRLYSLFHKIKGVVSFYFNILINSIEEKFNYCLILTKT
jgi:hypothetical protein